MAKCGGGKKKQTATTPKKGGKKKQPTNMIAILDHHLHYLTPDD